MSVSSTDQGLALVALMTDNSNGWMHSIVVQALSDDEFWAKIQVLNTNLKQVLIRRCTYVHRRSMIGDLRCPSVIPTHGMQYDSDFTISSGRITREEVTKGITTFRHRPAPGCYTSSRCGKLRLKSSCALMDECFSGTGGTSMDVPERCMF